MRGDEASGLRKDPANPADPFGRFRAAEPTTGWPVGNGQTEPYQKDLEIEALRKELARLKARPGVDLSLQEEMAALRAQVSALRRRNGSLVLTLLTLQR